MASQVFYPQHFKVTRPYLKAFSADIEAQAAKGLISSETSHTVVSRRVFEAYRAEGVEPGSASFNLQAFAAESRAALVYAEWAARGAMLYDFKRPLVDALSASGVGQIAISDLNFPFTGAYISFGARKDLILRSGAEVTGAFVFWNPGQDLRLMLTAPLPAGASLAERWEEVYYLRILEKNFYTDIETAIEQALWDDSEDLHQAAQKLKGTTEPRQLEGIGTIERALALNKANAATFSRCFQLIASALCYVTAFPSDTFVEWQDGTPEKLRAKATAATTKEGQRATSKLNALGYRQVHHVGQEFEASVERAGDGQMGPHLRRGHWRAQAYGPQLSLRKVKWIRPTRVLGGPPLRDEPRVYSTEPPGDRNSSGFGRYTQ
jgi:hypothetical protein